MLEAVCSSAVAPSSGLIFSSSVYGCSARVVLLRPPSFDGCTQAESGLSETLLLVLRSPAKRAWRNG